MGHAGASPSLRPLPCVQWTFWRSRIFSCKSGPEEGPLGSCQGQTESALGAPDTQKGPSVLVFPLTVEPLMEGATPSWSMLVRVPGTDAAGWP